MRCGAIVLVLVSAATGASAADLTGEWEFAATILNDVTYARGTLKTNGETLSGNLNENTVAGTVKGDRVVFTLARPNGQRVGEFQGQVTVDTLAGTGSWPGIHGDITWKATRAPKRPETARIHDFQPTEFHRVFSDAIPPVLHIFPGDTVRT